MKIYKIIILIVSVLLVMPLIGQVSTNQIVKLENGKYLFDGNTLSKYELGVAFKHAPDLAQNYFEALQSRKKAKGWGYATLTILGVTAISFGLDRIRYGSDCSDWCISVVSFVGYYASIYIAPLTGAWSLIRHSGSQKKIRDSIDAFNRAQLDQYGRTIEKPTIGFSNQGVGISITF